MGKEKELRREGEKEEDKEMEYEGGRREVKTGEKGKMIQEEREKKNEES
jgi:hypothetical protein